MKTVIALICTALLSFSFFANAGSTSSPSSARGPWVDCQYPDGSTDYIPSEICKQNGGKRKY
ncbi:hypothetical protein [Vibrio renipiscarius]|uniref:Uncharacterized protein n=1 Tax=Vibrio renipiscarius TaxID=1461322 RepID=A0A0C2P1V8_9VIBR|nr:hypothetical protein [Vibrio renipiscarius]KII80462.1 hypothetical protein OJ16_03820 [Vibrio renipiscarius]KII82277.1 hypothetical protein PL18_01400 [Vibrio renipiscarius]